MVTVVTTKWTSIQNSPGVFAFYEIWWKSSPIPKNTTPTLRQCSSKISQFYNKNRVIL